MMDSYFYSNTTKKDPTMPYGSKNGNIYDSLLQHLINAGIYSSVKEAEKDLEINESKKMINKCRRIMSDDQSDIFDKITEAILKKDVKFDDDGGDDDDKNIVLYSCSGLPGTGKSFVQDTLNAFCQSNGIRVTIVAPTNYIAFQQGGITLNSAVKDFMKSVIGLGNFDIDDLIIKDFLSKKLDKNDSFLQLENLRNASLPALVKKILKCANQTLLERYYETFKHYRTDISKIKTARTNVVLIDEGSMITNISLATLLASAPKQQKNIYVLFYGPNQLPPVSPKRNLKSCYSVDWGEYFPPNGHNSLTTFQRFRNDDKDSGDSFKKFIRHFNTNYFNTQNTVIDIDTIKEFEKNITIGGNLKDYKELKEEKVLIVATNEKRAIENNFRLEHEGEGKIYEIPAINDPIINCNNDRVFEQMGIDRMLRIRKGCVCFCRANLSPGLVKGVMLRVEDIEIDKNYNDISNITVSFLFDNGKNKEKKKLYRHSFETTIVNKLRGGFAIIKQFPITVGYAITAHGAQGKTLNCKVGIDIKCQHPWDILINIFFVAITRIREPSQLYMNIHPALWITENCNNNIRFEKIINNDYDKKNKRISNFKSIWENEYDENCVKRRKICNNSNGAMDDVTHKKIISTYPE